MIDLMRFVAEAAGPAAKELAQRLLPGLLSYVGGDEAKALEALAKVAKVIMDEADAKQVDELKAAWEGKRRQDIRDVDEASEGYEKAKKERRQRRRKKPKDGEAAQDD